MSAFRAKGDQSLRVSLVSATGMSGSRHSVSFLTLKPTCDMLCTDGASCHLASCNAGCNLECDGPRCDLDKCGLGCTVGCDRGRTCQIGECTEGGCQMRPIGTRAEHSILAIADCHGGYCSIECAPGDTCTIGVCDGGDCTISCAPGAICNCQDAGCSIIVP